MAEEKLKKKKLRDYSREKGKLGKCKLRKKTKRWEEKRKKNTKFLVKVKPKCMHGPPLALTDDESDSDNELITFDIRRPAGFLLECEKEVPPSPVQPRKPVSILRKGMKRSMSADECNWAASSLISPRDTPGRSISEDMGYTVLRRHEPARASPKAATNNGILSPPGRMKRRGSLGGMQFQLHNSEGESPKRLSTDGNNEKTVKDIQEAARYFENRNGEPDTSEEDPGVLLAIHAELRKAAANRTTPNENEKQKRRSSMDGSTADGGLMSPINRGKMKRRKSLREAVLSNATKGIRPIDLAGESEDEAVSPKSNRRVIRKKDVPKESGYATPSENDSSRRSELSLESCSSESKSSRRVPKGKISAIYNKFECMSSPARTVRTVSSSTSRQSPSRVSSCKVPLDASLYSKDGSQTVTRSSSSKFQGSQGVHLAKTKSSNNAPPEASPIRPKELKQIAVVSPSLRSVEKVSPKKKSKTHEEREKKKAKKAKKSKKSKEKEKKETKSPRTPRAVVSTEEAGKPIHIQSPSSIIDIHELECAGFAPEVTPEREVPQPSTSASSHEDDNECNENGRVKTAMRSSRLQDLIKNMGIQG